MRASRVLGEPARPINFYHCMSWTLRELPFWDDVEKEHLRELLTKLLAFSGLEIVTFCLMGNHGHWLLAVPSERESLEAMSDEAFLGRLACIYTEDEVELVALELDAHRQADREAQALTVRRRYLRRMHNLSAFMQELKQRFTTWYRPSSRTRRNDLARTLQERARGGRAGRPALHGRLHRPESDPRGLGERSARLSLVRLRGRRSRAGNWPGAASAP